MVDMNTNPQDMVVDASSIKVGAVEEAVDVAAADAEGVEGIITHMGVKTISKTTTMD